MDLRTTRRLVTTALVLYGGVSLVLMQFYLYLEYPLYLRISNTFIVGLYAAIALLTHSLGRGEERVRVLALFCTFTIGTFLCYPFPPAGTGWLSLAWGFVFPAVYFGDCVFLLHLGLLMRDDQPVRHVERHALRLLYGAAALFTITAGMLYANGMQRWTGLLPATAPAAHHLVRSIIVAAYAIAGFGTVTLVAYSALRAASIALRRQALAICAGVLPWALLRLGSAFIPGLSDAAGFEAIDQFVLVLLPTALFLAVNGLQLFGVNTYLRRSVLISLTLALLSASAYVMVLGIQLLLGHPSSSPWGLASACLAGAILMRFVLPHLSKMVDTIFFPERIALRHMSETIVGRVAQHTDLRVLAGTFTTGICEGLALVWAALYVLNETRSDFELSSRAGAAPPLEKHLPIALALAGDFGAKEERILRVQLGGDSNALLRIGPKRSGEHLSPDEMRELRLAAVQVAAMVENARLFAIATRDSVTGLYRRAVFEERLADERARLARYRSPFSLIMIDLDHFKRVNDTYGHTAGDDVLRTTGELLRAKCRDVDVAARYGGEELVVLLPNTGLEGAAKLAETLRAAIAGSTIAVGDHRLHVTASLGVAAADDTISAEDILERADQCLYRAKHGGRDRVELAARSLAVGESR